MSDLYKRLFLGFLLITNGTGFAQIITGEIEVIESTSTILQVDGINKAIIDSEGLLVNGSFSLDSSRHGKVYVASNTIQETHEFDLNELFPKLDMGHPLSRKCFSLAKVILSSKCSTMTRIYEQ